MQGNKKNMPGVDGKLFFFISVAGYSVQAFRFGDKPLRRKFFGGGDDAFPGKSRPENHFGGAKGFPDSAFFAASR
jgi:hypothetical protein